MPAILVTLQNHVHSMIDQKLSVCKLLGFLRHLKFEKAQAALEKSLGLSVCWSLQANVV